LEENYVKICLFSSLLFSSLLLILGCSNPALLIDDQNNNTITTLQARSIPKRSDVVKSEENVLNDRKLTISGKELYINSKFMRSIIPASRFPGITRGRDISSDVDFPNNEMVDSITKNIWNNTSEEEKKYYLDNIDEIIIDLDIVIEAEATNDDTKRLVADMKALNEFQDELYNGLGLDEAAITVTETRNGDRMGNFESIKYRAVNKHNRYRSSNEVIVKAYDLACFFLMSGDIEEIENIKKIFNADIDISKIKKLQVGDTDTRGSIGIGEWEFKKALNGAEDWIKKNGENGDIVSRCLWDSCFYGAYDHSGLLNKDRFIKNPKNSNYDNTMWASCILASYPSEYKAPAREERKPERLAYAAYEPLANFIEAKKMAVNKPKISSYGPKVLKTAVDKYYGKDGKKHDYDKWCLGYYYVRGLSCYYDHYSEYLKTTYASDIAPQQVNYCSYLAWYGYKYGVNIDIDSDTYRTSSGYIKVPQDIVNSGNPKITMIWVRVNQAAGCGLFGGGSGGYYIEEYDYSSCTTNLYSWYQY